MPTTSVAALAGLPAGLWRAAATAPHRLLLLDYDGTLAPFHVRRAEARPSRRTMDLLERIASSGTTTTAVVSGRSLAELIGLIGRLPVTLIGEHGWEVRRPDGHVEQYPLPPECAALLERAVALADVAGWGGRVERKRTALVLHTRDLAGAPADALLRAGQEAWSPLTAPGDLGVERIDGGIELRARHRDKGMAVRDLIAAAPTGSFAVYLGDDVTDEDAFRALRSTGAAIRVGPDDRDSQANGRLPSVDAVELFLARWLELVADHKGP